MPQDDRASALGETKNHFRARKILPRWKHTDINACQYPDSDSSVVAVSDLECDARCADMRGRCDVILLCVCCRSDRRFSTRQQMLRMNDLGRLFAVNDPPSRSGASQLVVHSMNDGRSDGLLCQVRHVISVWIE